MLRYHLIFPKLMDKEKNIKLMILLLFKMYLTVNMRQVYVGKSYLINANRRKELDCHHFSVSNKITDLCNQ